MKPLRTALIFLSVMLGMAAAHAQTAEAGIVVPSALPDSPVLGIVIALVLVAVVGSVVAIYRKRRADARRRYSDEGPATYIGGYETIDPRARKEPRLQGKKAVADKTDAAAASWSVPADFDVPRFLRKTKAYFMRLQASWDKGDVKDIRRFTTRELFGEFCKQLNERGSGPCATEIVTLGAELQGVETVGAYYIATVKFTGMVREEEADVAPFSEIWSLSKPLDGHRSWVLAGIQQPI